MFPEGEIEYAEPGSVRIIYDAQGRFRTFMDPETGRFMRKDLGIELLGYDPVERQWYDAFGNTLGVGAFGPSTSPYTHKYTFKQAEYSAWEGDPADFEPAPGAQLQVRLTIVDETGAIFIVYKSFGENRRYDADIEQQMIGEAVSEVVPGQKTVEMPSPPMEGIELRKDYTVQRVSYIPLKP
jgi:hypothetical protein